MLLLLKHFLATDVTSFSLKVKFHFYPNFTTKGPKGTFVRPDTFYLRSSWHIFQADSQKERKRKKNRFQTQNSKLSKKSSKLNRCRLVDFLPSYMFVLSQASFKFSVFYDSGLWHVPYFPRKLVEVQPFGSRVQQKPGFN